MTDETNDVDYLRKFNELLLLEIAAKIANQLSVKQEELKQCQWTNGESNTDTDFSKLSCKCAEDAWLYVKENHLPLQGSTITMTASIPDVICKFQKNGQLIPVVKTKIELKSSKNMIMPGSTINQLDINQPVIYCKRPKNADGIYEVRYGQYHRAMGESDIDLFQDRTPRPKLNFTKLFPSSQMNVIYLDEKKDAWITHYGKCAVNRLHKSCNYSWQDALTKSILHEALQNIETMEDLEKLRESVRPTLL